MGDMLKVKAVAGRRLPVERQAGVYVGYDRSFVDAGKNAQGEAVRRARFELTARTVDVPNTVYYRRALRRGDIVKATGALMPSGGTKPKKKDK